MRRLAFFTAVLTTVFACDYDRTPPIPPGTPDCTTICEMAWPCGGVLQNDLDACVASCDDNEHQAYRACIYQQECEVMPDCKLYAPPIPEPAEDDEATE